MRIWHFKSRKHIKIFAVVIVVSAVLFLIFQVYQWFRIRKTPEEGGNTAQDLTPNQDPEPSVPVDPEDVGLDFVLDTDYSAITVETEFPSYAKDTEEIRYTITNSHEGKGFYKNLRFCRIIHGKGSTRYGAPLLIWWRIYQRKYSTPLLKIIWSLSPSIFFAIFSPVRSL